MPNDSIFIKMMSKIQNIPLLGAQSHHKLMSDKRKSQLELMPMFEVTAQKAAVLLLFYFKEDEPYLVLTRRQEYNGTHSGQISFPGGKFEINDGSLKATALRETHEEIGVCIPNEAVIKTLSDIYIPPSNFWVTPFIAVVQSEILFQGNEEVAEILEIPFEEVMQMEATHIEISEKTNNNEKTPAYLWGNHIIWGATAMILTEMKDLYELASK